MFGFHQGGDAGGIIVHVVLMSVRHWWQNALGMLWRNTARRDNFHAKSLHAPDGRIARVETSRNWIPWCYLRKVIKDLTGASKNCKVTVDQARWTLDCWGLCHLERTTSSSSFSLFALFQSRTALCYFPKNIIPKWAESAPDFYHELSRILGKELIALLNGPFLRTLMALMCI